MVSNAIINTEVCSLLQPSLNPQSPEVLRLDVYLVYIQISPIVLDEKMVDQIDLHLYKEISTLKDMSTVSSSN